MPAKFKRLKDSSGQAMIIFALSFIVLCGMTALTADIGSVSMEKGRLQNVVDAAALAGAQDLPSTSAAKNTAAQYAEANGAVSAEITVVSPYNGDTTKLAVVCTRTIPHKFAKVIGISSANITVRAVAQKSGMSGGPFQYTIFSGSPNTALALNGSGLYIDGSAHSNYSFAISGSSQTITGSAEAVSSFTANGSTITIGGTCQGASISVNGSNIHIGNQVTSAASLVDMPDFSGMIQAEAESAGQVYQGNKTYNGSNINVDSPIYVDGNITVNSSHFSGKGIILATGNITFNGSNLKSSSEDAVCFYSKNGNITINGSSIELDGLVYAPNGSIAMNGSNQIINGRVIGKTLTFNGSNINFNSGSDDLDSLPQTSIKLVE